MCVCDLMRAASVVVASCSKVALAFGISCPYSKFLWCNDKVIPPSFLADCEKADACVESLPVLARLTPPFIKLEQGVRKGLNLFCDSLVDCFFFPSLLFIGQKVMSSSPANDLIAVLRCVQN